MQKPSRTPIGPLPAPEAPVLWQGPVTGSLGASASPLDGAFSYNWSLALASAPDTDVQTAQTTGARVSCTGLIPGQIYVVSPNAVGATGVPSPLTDTSQPAPLRSRPGPAPAPVPSIPASAPEPVPASAPKTN